MTNFEKHIEKAAREYSLSSDEKARMHRVVTSYMRFKPIRGAQAGVRATTFMWVAYLHRPIALALILVLASSGTITYAAEGALPGDALYAIKTNVNESVRVALATNAEAKAEVRIELAERRIEEAVTLAAEGRLDENTQNDLAAAFESHAESAAEEIEAIEVDDSSAATELSSRFETKLAAHEDVLAEVRAGLDNDATRGLSAAIRSKGMAVASIRTRAESRGGVSTHVDVALDAARMAMTMSLKSGEPEAATDTGVEAEEQPVPDDRAAKRMRDAAEKQLKTAQKKLKSAKLQGETRARAEAQLEFAEELIDDGRDLLDDDDIALAFHAFQESLVISEKMQVMTKAEPALAKARSSGRTTNRDSRAPSENVRAAAPATATIKVETAATSAVGIGGALDVQVMTAPALDPATATPETESDATTSRPLKIVPPSLQIFIPKDEDDNGDVRGNSDRHEDRHEDEDKDESGIHIDISL